MPRQWWPSLDAMREVIEGTGPWPSPSARSNGTFIPLDVDKYNGLAVVVGYGQLRSGREGIGFDDFQELDGEWLRRGGGGGGYPLELRDRLQDDRDALHLRMGGSSDESLYDDRPRFSHAIFVCGLDVAAVEVHRRHGVRVADLSIGPGWLAVLWVPDDPATVHAFVSDGTESFNWTSPREAA